MHKQDQLTFFYKKSTNYNNKKKILKDISITIGYVKCDGLQWNQLQQHKLRLWLNSGYTTTEDVDVHRDLDLSFIRVHSRR